MDDSQRAFKAGELLDCLNWMKSEAVNRLKERIPGLDIHSSGVNKVEFSDVGSDYPIEDGEIVLNMGIDMHIYGVSLEQLDKLGETGLRRITINGVATEKSPIQLDITYNMLYSFTSWSDKLEDDFTQ